MRFVRENGAADSSTNSPLAVNDRHRAAHTVSAIFKTVAVLILVGGVIAMLKLLQSHDDQQSVIALTGSVVMASWSAFFGHVLDLLIEIESNTHRTARKPTNSLPLPK